MKTWLTWLPFVINTLLCVALLAVLFNQPQPIHRSTTITYPGQMGLQGEVGAQGFQGATGAQGLKGDKGDQGVQGIQGQQGEKGDKGEQGEPGEKGADGENGADGRSPEFRCNTNTHVLQWRLVGDTAWKNLTGSSC